MPAYLREAQYTLYQAPAQFSYRRPSISTSAQTFAIVTCHLEPINTHNAPHRKRKERVLLHPAELPCNSSHTMSPSPAPSNNGELLQHGLHHLLQHNSNTSYPHYEHDEGVHLQSNYGSPAPQGDAYVYGSPQPRYSYQHQHQDPGLGIQYVRCMRLAPKRLF